MRMELAELVERYRIASGDVPPWLDLPVETKHLEVIAACFYQLVQLVEGLTQALGVMNSPEFLRALEAMAKRELLKVEEEGEDQAGRLH